MILEKKHKTQYVGPSALFNPLYVPPEVLFRKKEECSLSSILKDSMADKYSMNILYQGIQGIGKKTIVNKVLGDLFQTEDILNRYLKLNIECRNKTSEEFILSLITKLIVDLDTNLSINTLLDSKISRLWSIFKLLCKKVDKNIIFIFNNCENLTAQTQKKFLDFGKTSNISIISTFNKILRSSSLELISKYDIKRKLDYFTYNQLVAIFKQRIDLTFSHQIDTELTYIITDLILDNYVPVPGPGVSILRDLFPLLKENKAVQYHMVLNICENHFDSIKNIDDFNLLTYIEEENMLTKLFLDHLVNYFINKNYNYYISLKDLRELYFLSCEALQYEKKLEEFIQLTSKLISLGIICPSKKYDSKAQNLLLEAKYLDNCYFLTINPNKLNMILDTAFGKYN
jgi:hypothetical protein